MLLNNCQYVEHGWRRWPTYRRSQGIPLAFLLPPHFHQWYQAVIARCLVEFNIVQCLSQYLLYTRIFAITQQLFHSSYELGVKVLREGPGRVVGQDAGQHNRIVLCITSTVVLLAQVSADGGCGFFRGCRTRFGGIDNGWKMEVFLASGVRVRGA